MRKSYLAVLLCALPLGRAASASDMYDEPARAAKDLLSRLVAADTSNPPGNEARAVELGAKLLEQAGIGFQVTEFAPGRKNLIARLKGKGAKPPVLLIAHTDVVGAQGQAWTSDPHAMTESNGYWVGRGVLDDLGMAAVELETLILLKKSGARLNRDVIVAWTGDEESGGSGIRAVLQDSSASVAAAFAVNEGGGLVLEDDGKPKYVGLQTAEKTYQDFELIARGPTGHSSIPVPGNAIARLARAVDRVAAHPFPARLLPVTRAYLSERSAVEAPAMAAAMKALAAAEGPLPAEALKTVETDPLMSAQVRTTCVPTLLSGGTRVNALPAEAKANVNCRILPDESVEETRKALADAIDDSAVEIKGVNDFGAAAPSPIDGEFPRALRKAVQKRWPGLPVVPTLFTGATDSRFLRAAGIPAYGFNPIGASEADERRQHGADERIRETSLKQGLELMHRLVLELDHE